MEFFAISGLLNGLAALGLASFVYFRAPKDPRHWTFGLVGISTAVWSLGYFAWQLAPTETIALIFLRVLMAGAIFIPITFFHHVAHLLKSTDTHSKFIQTNYGIGLVFLLLDGTPYFVKGVQEISIFQFWGVPGFMFHICLIWWFSIVFITEGYLIAAYRKEVGIRRRQIRNIMIGSGIGFIGGATNFPLWYGIEILPYGTIGFTLYISLVAYALLRFHWLDFSVYVEKGISYFALLLLVSQPIYPLLLLAQKSVFGTINISFSLVQLIVHFLTVGCAYQMKVGTRGAIARTVLKGREYRFHALNRLTEKASQLQKVSELGPAIFEILQKGMGAKKAAIFILDHKVHRYRAIASFGFSEEAPIIRDGLAFSDDLPQMLLLNHGRVSLKNLMNPPSDQTEIGIIKQFEGLGLEWFHPLLENGRLLGFLAVGSVSDKSMYVLGGETFWNAIVQESVLVLENSVLREEIQRFQDMLRQMDRLRSVEAMADGLTEELHYPVASIKAFVQVAQLRRHEGEFIDRLHRVVGEDLAKIEDLTKEIREYVKPLSGSLNPKIHVHEVIDSCLTFVASNPSYHHFMIEKNFGHDIPFVSVERQSFMQAIFNGLLFLFNHHTQLSGSLRIETKVENLERTLLQVAVWWNTKRSFLNPQQVPVEDWIFEDTSTNVPDLSSEQGLYLASQIIQRHSGCFQLLINEGEIFGFQIYLPIGHSYNQENSVASLRIPSLPHKPVKSVNLTPGPGHLLS